LSFNRTVDLLVGIHRWFMHPDYYSFDL